MTVLANMLADSLHGMMEPGFWVVVGLWLFVCYLLKPQGEI